MCDGDHRVGKGVGRLLSIQNRYPGAWKRTLLFVIAHCGVFRPAGHADHPVLQVTRLRHLAGVFEWAQRKDSSLTTPSIPFSRHRRCNPIAVEVAEEMVGRDGASPAVNDASELVMYKVPCVVLLARVSYHGVGPPISSSLQFQSL